MLTDQERKIRDFEKRLKNAEIERDILKKPWHLQQDTDVVFQTIKEYRSLFFGEEDVPNVRSFLERILYVVRSS